MASWIGCGQKRLDVQSFERGSERRFRHASYLVRIREGSRVGIPKLNIILDQIWDVSVDMGVGQTHERAEMISLRRSAHGTCLERKDVEPTHSIAGSFRSELMRSSGRNRASCCLQPGLGGDGEPSYQHCSPLAFCLLRPAYQCTRLFKDSNPVSTATPLQLWSVATSSQSRQLIHPARIKATATRCVLLPAEDPDQPRQSSASCFSMLKWRAPIQWTLDPRISGNMMNLISVGRGRFLKMFFVRPSLKHGKCPSILSP